MKVTGPKLEAAVGSFVQSQEQSAKAAADTEFTQVSGKTEQVLQRECNPWLLK